MKLLGLCNGNYELNLCVNSVLPPSPLPLVTLLTEAQGVNHKSGTALYGMRAKRRVPLALSRPGLGFHEEVALCHGLQGQATWVQMPTQLLTSCVTWRKLHNLSVPCFINL